LNVKWTREKELMTFTTTQISTTMGVVVPGTTATNPEEGIRTRAVTVMTLTTRTNDVAGVLEIVDVTRMDEAAAAVEEDKGIEDVVPILLMMVQMIRKILTKIPTIPTILTIPTMVGEEEEVAERKRGVVATGVVAVKKDETDASVEVVEVAVEDATLPIQTIIRTTAMTETQKEEIAGEAKKIVAKILPSKIKKAVPKRSKWRCSCCSYTVLSLCYFFLLTCYLDSPNTYCSAVHVINNNKQQSKSVDGRSNDRCRNKNSSICTCPTNLSCMGKYNVSLFDSMETANGSGCG
jgi:hypothetical protein